MPQVGGSQDQNPALLCLCQGRLPACHTDPVKTNMLLAGERTSQHLTSSLLSTRQQCQTEHKLCCCSGWLARGSGPNCGGHPQHSLTALFPCRKRSIYIVACHTLVNSRRQISPELGGSTLLPGPPCGKQATKRLIAANAQSSARGSRKRTP